MSDFVALFLLAVRFVVAGWLLAAAVAKWVGFSEFVSAVRAYRLVPVQAVRAVAVGVVLAETLCAVLLVTGALVTVAGAVAGLLLVVFAVAMGINVRRGRRIACGCASSSGDRVVSWALVARNLVLAVAVGLVAALPVTGLSMGGTGPAWWPAGPVLTVSGGDGLAVLVAVATALMGRRLAAALAAVIRADRAVAAVLAERAS
ncbi:MauE/DoxX family redox-associated membrane protein [Nocardia nepalensis]|uniref:MauE/DoxX family redox-associated membrane protein n=1 Tax=Nocardia nepalensis TaxID=3375448 RepID=UPI003B6845F2